MTFNVKFTRLFCPIPSIRRLSRCSSEPSSILRGAGKQNRVWWNPNKRLNSPDVWEKKSSWKQRMNCRRAIIRIVAFWLSFLLYFNILLRLDSFFVCTMLIIHISNIRSDSRDFITTSLDLWLRSRAKWIVPTFQTVEKLWCVCFPPLLPRPSNYCLTLLERSYEWCVYEYNASSPRFN